MERTKQNFYKFQTKKKKKKEKYTYIYMGSDIMELKKGLSFFPSSTSPMVG